MRSGTVVMLTGRALRSMGLRIGEAGAQRWIVVECPCDLCSQGRHISTASGRHFARAAVRAVRAGEHWRDEGTPASTAEDTCNLQRGLERGRRKFGKISSDK